MLRVLSIDIGKQLGFGLLGPGVTVRSGSLEILQSWHPLGAAALTFENRVGGLIDQHQPTHLAVARPFVRRFRGKMIDTPDNLVPMFGAFMVLHRLAAVRGLPPPLVMQESDARSHLVGKNMMMAKSAAIKKAVMQACRDRGWPCRDDHAGDALCVAAAALEQLQPSRAHQTTPLFVAASAAGKPVAKRQKRAKSTRKHPIPAPPP